MIFWWLNGHLKRKICLREQMEVIFVLGRCVHERKRNGIGVNASFHLDRFLYDAKLGISFYVYYTVSSESRCHFSILALSK